MSNPSQYTVVELRNNGDKPFVDGYNGEIYEIPPGESLIVPWAAMCLWLGDPTARDGERDRYRTEEQTRLATRYGLATTSDRALWRRSMPTVTAYTLAGEEIPTVASDPDNERDVQVTTPDSQDRLALMEREMARMQARIDAFEGRKPGSRAKRTTQTPKSAPTPVPAPEAPEGELPPVDSVK